MAIIPPDDQRLGYLVDEYLFPQDQYEDHDKRSLTIKAGHAPSNIAGQRWYALAEFEAQFANLATAASTCRAVTHAAMASAIPF